MSNYLKDNKELMKEYDYEKNDKFDLDTLTLGSDRKVWWICSKCGYEWLTDPNHRSRGQGCPQCYKEKTKNE